MACLSTCTSTPPCCLFTHRANRLWQVFKIRAVLSNTAYYLEKLCSVTLKCSVPRIQKMVLKKVWCQLHAIVNFSNLLLKIYKVGRSKYYSFCSDLRSNTYICLGTKPYTDALKFGPEGPQLFYVVWLVSAYGHTNWCWW